MTLLDEDAYRRYLSPLAYGVGGFILMDQTLQLVVFLGPPDFSVPAWRFQAASQLAVRVPPLLIADAAIIGAGNLLGHRTILRWWGLGHLLLALGLLGVLAPIVRDGASVLYGVPGERITTFLVLRFRAIMEALLSVPLLGFLGWRLFRTPLSPSHPATSH